MHYNTASHLPNDRGLVGGSATLVLCQKLAATSLNPVESMNDICASVSVEQRHYQHFDQLGKEIMNLSIQPRVTEHSNTARRTRTYT